MCGICGVVTNGPAANAETVRAMIGRLSHRGPDGSGVLLDGRAALGHTRLAIIDVEGGFQPLCTPDGSVWVTFNGEIFNYVELAEELRARGHRFRTSSDTEVIVHSWEEWGSGCFNRFNGQWAIALWDRVTKQLVLSRDRLGVRPLYYYRTPSKLVFASEIKAIFADPSVTREFDLVGLDQVLTYWCCVAPRTPFARIEQLPPGHVAYFDSHGFRSEPYWTIDFPPQGREPNQDLTENSGILRNLIEEATRLRFVRSDVPVGAYLSGGIDSTVTASAIRHFTDAPLDTFSLRFADAEFDEGSHQQLVTNQLGTRHHEVVVTGADIAQVFPDVVWHSESPLLRAAPAPLFILSRLVRELGYKVVVTGEGADEVLGGYDIFREAKVREFWARDPDSEVRGRATELLYPWMARNPGRVPAFARGFFGQDLDLADPAMSHRPRWNSTAILKRMLAPDVANSPVGDVGGMRMPAEAESWDLLGRAQWLEMMTLLPGYILSSQGDRMLMANSIEGRFPFLDRDVVAFANQLPARHKLFGLEEKLLLKLAFKDLVPAAIRQRPKQPYRAPDASSFFNETRPDWVSEVLSPHALRSAGVFDPKIAGSVAHKAASSSGRLGNTDNMRVMALLSTQLIYSQFILGDGGRSHMPPPEPFTTIDLATHEGNVDVATASVRCG